MRPKIKVSSQVSASATSSSSKHEYNHISHFSDDEDLLTEEGDESFSLDENNSKHFLHLSSSDYEFLGNRSKIIENETWLKRVLKSALRLSSSVLKYINLLCVPIYWFLVQLFVFEKWILNRRRTVIEESRNLQVRIPRLDLSRGTSPSGAILDETSIHYLYYDGQSQSHLSQSEEQVEHQNYHRDNREFRETSSESSFLSKLYSVFSKVRSTISNKVSPPITAFNERSPTTSFGATGNSNGNYNGRSSFSVFGNRVHDEPYPYSTTNNSRQLTSYFYEKIDSCKDFFNNCKRNTNRAYRGIRGRCSTVRANGDGGGDDDGGPRSWCSNFPLCLILTAVIFGGLAWWLANRETGFGNLVNSPSWLTSPFFSSGREGEVDIHRYESTFDIRPPQPCPSPSDSLGVPLTCPEYVPPKCPEQKPVLPIPIPPTETPCPSCPPGNNIDIDALKSELTGHFTSLIKDQCKCDCPVGPAPTIVGAGYSDEEIDRRIQLALKKYDADKTGLPDVALEPAGGSVVSTRCTKSSQNKNSVVHLLGIPIWSPPNNPRTVIQPGLVPGECWSFEGSIGYIVIKLAGPSYIVGFSLEHISKSISPLGHIKSAPKDFQVVGLMDYNDASSEFVFGDYVYEDNGVPLQYFPVQNQPNQAYPYVELKINSNHGNIDFTCVYRLRVHGHF